MIELAKEIFPLNRSLTGDGNLKTLKILKRIIKNLKIKSFNSGKKVFDWKIPKEWNVNEAWLKDKNGKKIVDYKKNNLSIIQYSSSVNKIFNFKKLKKKLYTIKSQPNAIPYLISYYKNRWGFCIKYKDYKKFVNKDKFHVFIDAKFKNGKMPYGEYMIKGKSKKEIFFSTYICHPSMANNEVSGIVLSTYIAKFLNSLKNNYYSYRILFIPETIGSIAYLQKNHKHLKANVVAGFNITCVGDEGNFSYLGSQYENTFSDKILKRLLKIKKIKYKKYSWLKRGSDERQYCSPHINLPVVSLMKTKYNEYPEYHTSLDQIGKVVTKKGLTQSLNFYKYLIRSIEKSIIPQTCFPCEPFLTKYNLMNTLGGQKKTSKNIRNILNFFSYCDGSNSIEDISNFTEIPIKEGLKIFRLLKSKKIVYRV
tara:strand:+ start:774 stop:2042 length:1269 start_codon:yes stop_codon:yes gene_type:complete